MTVFDHLNSILFTKKGDNLKNVDDEVTFQPFMINRWISMHSATFAKIVNNTTNRYCKNYNLFSKHEYNQFLTTILPQCRFKRIPYIKKSKKEVDKDENLKIELMAKSNECSQREIKEMLAIEESLSK